MNAASGEMGPPSVGPRGMASDGRPVGRGGEHCERAARSGPRSRRPRRRRGRARGVRGWSGPYRRVLTHQARAKQVVELRQSEAQPRLGGAFGDGQARWRPVGRCGRRSTRARPRRAVRRQLVERLAHPPGQPCAGQLVVDLAADSASPLDRLDARTSPRDAAHLGAHPVDAAMVGEHARATSAGCRGPGRTGAAAPTGTRTPLG